MSNVIEKRRLGRTDLYVSPIGLGTMQFAGGIGFFRFFLEAVPLKTMNEIVKVALDSGINWIDTAEAYGSGASEKSVSQALTTAKQSPDEILITTKWMPLLKSAKSISKSAEKSKRRLEPYNIDLYLVHQPYSRSSIKSQMNAMADIVENGIVRTVGVSNFSQKKMIAAHETLEKRDIPLATNQVRFSLLDRRIEQNGVLETAKELDITITAYTPLGMGILTGKLHKDEQILQNMPRFRRNRLQRNLKKTEKLVNTLITIAKSHEATAAQIALNWAINVHGDTIVAIPGASKPYQAQQNAGAMHVALTREEIETLSTLSLEL